MNIMLYILFKIVRKINTLIQYLYCRLKIKYYYHLSGKRFSFGKKTSFGKSFSVKTDLSLAHLYIGYQTYFRNNCTLRIENNGRLTIGNNCFFNNNFSATSLGSIVIGNNTQIGENVLLYDANHQHNDNTKLISQQGYSISAISIGNNCWIGSNVIILKGVEIGDNTVVGAGCILHKSIPANSMVINQQQQIITKRIVTKIIV